MTTMMLLSLMIGLLFPMMKHPLSMGLILILQTITIALTTGLMINTFWYSYILLMTMLSGALVLFIYMASVASNEKFNTSMTMATFMIMFTITATASFLIVDQLSEKKVWSTMSKDMFYNEQTTSLLKLFNMHNMSITMMIISYLFFTMIAISFIVNVFEGPLRKKG